MSATSNRKHSMRIHGMYLFLYDFISFSSLVYRMVNILCFWFGKRTCIFSIEIKYITQIRLDRALFKKKKKFSYCQRESQRRRRKENRNRQVVNIYRRGKKCGTSYLLSFIESASLYEESIYCNKKKWINHNRIYRMKHGPEHSKRHKKNSFSPYHREIHGNVLRS